MLQEFHVLQTQVIVKYDRCHINQLGMIKKIRMDTHIA